MMIGEYRHNIDAKKRIAVPAKFRKEIGEKAVIAKGQEKCLFVYPVGEWEKVAEKLSQLPTGSADNRNFVRIFLPFRISIVTTSADSATKGFSKEHAAASS